MSGFEFSLIPVAIIIGVALTQILGCWARVIRHWPRLQNPGLFLSFTVIAMAGILSHFVGDWAYRNIEMHFGQLVLIILPTLAMVLAISVILPADDEIPSDLGGHYFTFVGKASGLFLVGIALSVVPDLLPGAVNTPEPWMVGAVMVPFVCITVLRHAVVHLLAHAGLWVVMLLQMSSLTSFGSIQ